MYIHSFFFLVAVDGWWFHLLAIVNRVVINMAEQVCLRYVELLPSNGIARSYFILFFTFLRNPHTDFQCLFRFPLPVVVNKASFS